VLLAIGVILPNISIGAAGFVLMGVGVYCATLPTGATRRKKPKEPAGPEATGDTPRARKMADAGQSSFRGGHREMALWSMFFWL